MANEELTYEEVVINKSSDLKTSYEGKCLIFKTDVTFEKKKFTCKNCKIFFDVHEECEIYFGEADVCFENCTFVSSREDLMTLICNKEQKVVLKDCLFEDCVFSEDGLFQISELCEFEMSGCTVRECQNPLLYLDRLYNTTIKDCKFEEHLNCAVYVECCGVAEELRGVEFINCEFNGIYGEKGWYDYDTDYSEIKKGAVEIKVAKVSFVHCNFHKVRIPACNVDLNTEYGGTFFTDCSFTDIHVGEGFLGKDKKIYYMGHALMVPYGNTVISGCTFENVCNLYLSHKYMCREEKCVLENCRFSECNGSFFLSYCEVKDCEFIKCRAYERDPEHDNVDKERLKDHDYLKFKLDKRFETGEASLLYVKGMPGRGKKKRMCEVSRCRFVDCFAQDFIIEPQYDNGMSGLNPGICVFLTDNVFETCKTYCGDMYMKHMTDIDKRHNSHTALMEFFSDMRIDGSSAPTGDIVTAKNISVITKESIEKAKRAEEEKELQKLTKDMSNKTLTELKSLVEQIEGMGSKSGRTYVKKVLETVQEKLSADTGEDRMPEKEAFAYLQELKNVVKAKENKAFVEICADGFKWSVFFAELKAMETAEEVRDAIDKNAKSLSQGDKATAEKIYEGKVKQKIEDICGSLETKSREELQEIKEQLCGYKKSLTNAAFVMIEKELEKKEAAELKELCCALEEKSIEELSEIRNTVYCYKYEVAEPYICVVEEEIKKREIAQMEELCASPESKTDEELIEIGLRLKKYTKQLSKPYEDRIKKEKNRRKTGQQKECLAFLATKSVEELKSLSKEKCQYTYLEQAEYETMVSEEIRKKEVAMSEEIRKEETLMLEGLLSGYDVMSLEELNALLVRLEEVKTQKIKKDDWKKKVVTQIERKEEEQFKEKLGDLSNMTLEELLGKRAELNKVDGPKKLIEKYRYEIENKIYLLVNRLPSNPSHGELAIRWVMLKNAEDATVYDDVTALTQFAKELSEDIFTDSCFTPEHSKFQKKAQNAINAYAKNVNISDIILLVDTTIFGSAKEGYIFTKHGIYGKDYDNPPYRCLFKNIKTLDVTEKYGQYQLYAMTKGSSEKLGRETEAGKLSGVNRLAMFLYAIMCFLYGWNEKDVYVLNSEKDPIMLMLKGRWQKNTSVGQMISKANECRKKKVTEPVKTTRFCGYCGKQISISAKFCGHCGKEVKK